MTDSIDRSAKRFTDFLVSEKGKKTYKEYGWHRSVSIDRTKFPRSGEKRGIVGDIATANRVTTNMLTL